MLTSLLSVRAGAGNFGGSVALDSDDLFRGQSLSDQQTSVQAELHYSAAQWFVGVSAELVRRGFGSGHGAEVIGFVGAQFAFGDDWLLLTTLRHYDYPGSAYRSQYNYDELQASVRWRERVSLSVAASPDAYASDYDYHPPRQRVRLRL